MEEKLRTFILWVFIYLAGVAFGYAWHYFAVLDKLPAKPDVEIMTLQERAERACEDSLYTDCVRRYMRRGE